MTKFFQGFAARVREDNMTNGFLCQIGPWKIEAKQLSDLITSSSLFHSHPTFFNAPQRLIKQASRLCLDVIRVFFVFSHRFSWLPLVEWDQQILWFSVLSVPTKQSNSFRPKLHLNEHSIHLCVSWFYISLYLFSSKLSTFQNDFSETVWSFGNELCVVSR